MNALSTPQETLLPQGATRIVNDLWPAAPARPEQRPTSFSKSFGLKMLELHMRQLLASAKGLTHAERLEFACLADGVEAASIDDNEGLRDALDAAVEMERCR